MTSKFNSLNFRLDKTDRDLFDWYCGFQGKKTSERLRELVEQDLKKARTLIKNMDTSSNGYLADLKRRLDEQ